jgi:hypothetical protein
MKKVLISASLFFFPKSVYIMSCIYGYEMKRQEKSYGQRIIAWESSVWPSWLECSVAWLRQMAIGTLL